MKRLRTVKYFERITFSDKIFRTKVSRFQAIYLSLNFSILKKNRIESISFLHKSMYIIDLKEYAIGINKSASNSI